LPGHTDPAGARVFRRCLVAALAAGTAFASVALIGITFAPAASAAATAPAAAQCNPPDGYPTTAPTGAGRQVSCNIAITNTETPAGAVSSTMTTTTCLAAAGVLPPAECSTTVIDSTQLVTSVNQCNGIIVGGGSNLICNVIVTNDIASGTATTGATVNQCIGSGAGGGIQPTLLCAPTASTTNATVTQCNGSGNGGGGSTRVKCTVTGASTALPVTINQCNGSSNGGGSTVTCTTTFINEFGSSSPTGTSGTPSGTGGTGAPSAGGGTSASGGTGTPATPGGSGATGLTGTAAGAGGSTGPPTIVGTLGAIPSGAPQTGFGGASRSHDSDFLYAAALAFMGAGLAVDVVIRRRRALSVQGAHEAP
jgi:hypothetical protein